MGLGMGDERERRSHLKSKTQNRKSKIDLAPKGKGEGYF
jgi:hypothetical protein